MGLHAARGPFGIRHDYIFIIIHGIILTGLMMSGSRAGFIAESVIIITALSFKLSPRKFIVYSCLLSIIFFLILHTIPAIIYNNSTELKSFLKYTIIRDSSNQERLETIYRAISLFKESPIFGTGLGFFVENSTRWFREQIVIHSTPIWILTEFGLVGFCIMGFIFFSVMKSTIQDGMKSPRNRAVILLLIVFATFGLVHDIFYQRIFWLSLGVCLAQPFRPISPFIGWRGFRFSNK